MANKGEKGDMIRSINASLTAAGLPPIPTSCLFSMTVRDLHQFKDQWISPVCGRLVGSKSS